MCTGAWLSSYETRLAATRQHVVVIAGRRALNMVQIRIPF